MKRYFFFLFLLLCQPILAEQFQAPLTHTQWQVTTSPLECTLRQAIPDFGEAMFSRRTGQALSLTYITTFFPAKAGQAVFEVAQALWQNSQARLALTTIPVTKGQTRFSITGKPADNAFTHMREGRFPTLRYHSLNAHEELEVFLSTVHLADALPEFEQCLAQLYPDRFEDVQHLTVYFELEKAELSDKARAALKRVADYVNIDPAVKRIDVRGYTDNHGRKRLNIALSEARALAVKNYLVKECHVPESKITTSFHREFFPAKSNATAQGRAYNRRAEIELFR